MMAPDKLDRGGLIRPESNLEMGIGIGELFEDTHIPPIILHGRFLPQESPRR